MILTLLLACGERPATPVPDLPVWIEDRAVDAGEPVVLHAPAGTQIPAVEGITPSPRDETTWELRGEPGSYHLEVGGVALYFDVGVEGPTGGPLEDVLRPPPPEPPLWPKLLAGAVALVALAGAGAWAWRRFKPVPPPPPPEPADRVARREWAALRGGGDLGPEDLARELSAVYRRYLDATHPWPATARTTREILDNLAGDLTAVDLDRARRLLGAMDLIKFSERGAHAGIFDALDADFDALVRPAVRRA